MSNRATTSKSGSKSNEQDDPAGFDLIENMVSKICSGNVDLITLCNGGASSAEPKVVNWPSDTKRSSLGEADGGNLERELSNILRHDAHHIVFLPLAAAAFSSLAKEKQVQLVRYARRCEERTKTGHIFSISYNPTPEERNEISDLSLARGGDSVGIVQLKPWSIVMKKGLVSYHTLTKGEVLSTNPTGTKVGQAKDESESMEAELILLSNAFFLIPSRRDSSTDKSNQEVAFNYASVTAVMDLGVCSTRALLVGQEKESTNHASPFVEGGKALGAAIKKSVFTPKKTVLKSLHMNKTGKDSPARRQQKNLDCSGQDDVSCTDSESFDEDKDESALRIVVDDGGTITSFNISCASPLEKLMFLHALHRIISGLPGCRIREPHNVHDSDQDLGRRHRVLRTSIYSACILRDSQMLHNIIQSLKAKKLIGNRLDTVSSLQNIIDKPDSAGYTAAHYAVLANTTGCLRVLLDAGANPNVKDRDMKSPVDHAAERQNRRAREMLVASGGVLDKTLIQESDDEDDCDEDGFGSVPDTFPPPSSTKTWNRKTPGAAKKSVVQFGDATRKRGEEIEKMHSKAHILNRESVAYKDMAAQFKKKYGGPS